MKQTLAIATLALVSGSGMAGVLFSDDFSKDTSAEYASGGHVSDSWKTPGSLAITGNGVATFSTPDFGWNGSYFGFGRALGCNVLTDKGDKLVVSMTFQVSGVSSNVGVLALYAAKGTDAKTSQNPYTAMPAIGTYFDPAGGDEAFPGMKIVGNTGKVAQVLNWPGDEAGGNSMVWTGKVAALSELSTNQDYTMVMTITRKAGTLPAYTVTTTLNGETVEGPLSVENLNAINQVGLRFYAIDELNPGGGFDVIINEFSVAVDPDPKSFR